MATKLKATRTGHRSVISRFVNKFETKRNEEEVEDEELSSILNLITEKKDLLQELNQQILDQMTEDEVEREITETDEYTFDLNAKIRNMRKVLNPQNIHRTTSSLNAQAESFHLPDHITIPASMPSHINENGSFFTTQRSDMRFPEIRSVTSASMQSQFNKLPKLDLPKFDGNILEWNSFWDSFESSVHSNPSLSDVQKFNYLRSLLQNEALQTVAGFALTNTNYNKAICLLQERFGQEYKITSAHMQALLEVPFPKNTPESMRIFYDKTETLIRGLESLGQDQNSYGSLLIPVIMNKLPGEIRKNLAREHGMSNWTLGDLRKCLFREISIMEAGKSVDTCSDYDSPPYTATFFTGTKPKQANKKTEQINKPCVFCKDVHAPTNCTKVTDVERRMQIVKQDKLCFNCLGKHRVSECKSRKSCKICNRRHHTSICNNQNDKRHENTQSVSAAKTQKHNANEVRNETVTVLKDSTASVMHTASDAHYCQVLLKTAIAPVCVKSQSIEANILFDEGAQRSFITEELAGKLQMQPSGNEVINISGFGQVGDKVRHLDSGTVYVQSETGDKIPVEVLVVPTIAVPLTSRREHIAKLPHLKGLKLAHPVSADETFEVSLLIGADHYWDIVQDKVVRGNGPTAVKSKIGYLLSGPCQGAHSNKSNLAMMNVMVSHKNDECDLERFWKVESLGIVEKENQTEDKKYFDHYKQSCLELRGNKYIAKLPWKDDHSTLPSNKEIARRRTECVVNRLAKDPDMLKHYASIISEQEKKGFVEKVKEDAIPSTKVHYIPHHPVKKDSSTTPIRIVYDCSCRQSSDKPSLNDCLRSDPPLLNDITSLLLKFRQNKFAVSTDIEKAFLQIELEKEDRDVTRFYWLKDPTDPTSELILYRFKAVLFGATCSPFILNATLLRHLQDNVNDVTDIIKEDLYVDNILSSFDKEEDLLKYFHSARALMSSGGFNLRSWASNSDALNNIAKSEGVLDKDQQIKVLGLRWNNNSDTITYAQKSCSNIDETLITKREVLSQSSKIYDPLGIISPVTVRGKILMQEIWKRKFDWDEILPIDIQCQWAELSSDLQKASSIEIPRYYFRDITDNVESMTTTLHVFADASKKAYGACAYIVNGKQSHLVMAKSRVAPLKPLTIPQLELLAALTGAKMAKHILTNLRCSDVFYWSDSQIVLNWLQTSKTLKTYVEKRIREIQDLTRGYTWRYCPTADNPADLLSRGISAEQFLEKDVWMNGPRWISDHSKWPQWNGNESVVLTTVDQEQDKTDDNLAVSGSTDTRVTVIDIQRFNSYMKLIRVTAYVRRFIKNCRSASEDRQIGILSTDELNEASIIWIKNIQQTDYHDVLKGLQLKTNHHLIRQLRLYLDEDGLIRCGGRINNAPISLEARFPYLLPAKHSFTRLLIMDTHQRNMHASKGTTITLLRQKYWIPSIRHVVGKTLRKCVPCRKVSGKSYTPPDPPPLPKDRMSDATPFTVTGVDFTGAIHVKLNGRDKKVYVCLFTCANTRAVHLEIVKDLTEETFLMAFRRFISRKSLPRIMISDNGTTFVSAAEEIRKLTESKSVHETLGNYGTCWKFIPKRAPWYGGFWERLIGLTKSCLRKVLGRAYVDYESLVTVITEIEAILNDRPLTYIGADVTELSPLTPSHLLYGRRINSVIYPLQDTEDENQDCNNLGTHKRLKREVNRRFQLIEHFTKRWRQEYLTSLREFHRISGNNAQTIKVGDIVQVHDDSPRTTWKIAIVEELIYGRDNLVRSAVIRTNSGVTNRPIVKLYPLEVHHEEGRDKDGTCRHDRRAKAKAKQNIKDWIK